MGEGIRFIAKTERERIRLIRETRAMYDSVFPRAVRTQQLFSNRVSPSRVAPSATPHGYLP
jgi:hypothetical protein